MCAARRITVRLVVEGGGIGRALGEFRYAPPDPYCANAALTSARLASSAGTVIGSIGRDPDREHELPLNAPSAPFPRHASAPPSWRIHEHQQRAVGARAGQLEHALDGLRRKRVEHRRVAQARRRAPGCTSM